MGALLVLDLLLTGAVAVVTRMMVSLARLSGVIVTGREVLARAVHQPMAVASKDLHLEAVAFWLDGIAHLAETSLSGRDINCTCLRQFSLVAVVLAPLALLTGCWR